MDNIQAQLRHIFGFDQFRAGQQDIVEAVCAGKNVLAIMPTGGGKSLCYQFPALLRNGVTIVISPLIALMRDQVRALEANGVGAGALTSVNTQEETDAVYAQLHDQTLRLLYLAPERLASAAMQSALSGYNVQLIAVDEAHCVSQWGHDFRPDYLRIGELRRKLNVPLAAFTATADAETRRDIVERLFGGVSPETFLRGFDRPNIHLSFQPKESPRKQILNFAAARKGQSGIVYCATRAKTESLSLTLGKAGHNACYYHGGMEAAARRQVETRFATEDGLIVVATVAFGMGVDKPDIRWVAHADLPKSIESYYQEIGRAGRDGAPAEALTLYGSDDIRLRRGQIDEGLAAAERKMADHGRLNALLELAAATECRRKTLLSYFGDEEVTCDQCDLCAKPPKTYDGTTAVRKALSAVLRTEERFGVGHLIDLLIGKETDKIRAFSHQNLPTFGVGQELNSRAWQSVFRQMMVHDLLRPDVTRHGALSITENALPILRDQDRITLREESEKKHKQRSQERSLISQEDTPLLSALKSKRKMLAKAARIPAYIVFNDKTLIDMADQKPSTLDDMARIYGVGAKKLELYGMAFLSVIMGDMDRVNTNGRKLAGQSDRALYDRLLETQTSLMRGQLGRDKPMSCSMSLLAEITRMKPKTPNDMVAILGLQKAERFGDAFLDVLERLT